MRLGEGRLDDDEAEILVDADLGIDQPLHHRLIVADPRGHELDKIVVAARDQMAFHRLLDLLQRLLKAGKVDLAVVLQGDLGEDGQGRAQLGHVDLRRIAGDIARLLQLLNAHQAGAGRQVDQVGQLDIGDAAVLLQLVQDADVDAVQLHGRRLRSAPAGSSIICGDLNGRGERRGPGTADCSACPKLPHVPAQTAGPAASAGDPAYPAGTVGQNDPGTRRRPCPIPTCLPAPTSW